MTKLEVSKDLLKEMIFDFIQWYDATNTDIDIGPDTLRNMKKELWNYEYRLKPLNEALLDLSYDKWKKENHKLTELYKNVAIQNASNSNEPYIVALNTIREYERVFNCK